MVAAFWAAGFTWWEAYPVLRERYYEGVGGERPYQYWVWADLAAWTFTVGLATWAAFPRMWTYARRRTPLAVLALTGLVCIAIATLSAMSKAEVERIWLPFTLWIVTVPALTATGGGVRSCCRRSRPPSCPDPVDHEVVTMPEQRDQVLIVEDDPQVRDVVRRYLERDGLAVQVTASGTEGLELARRSRPDVILLDVMLPGLSGLEVCRILRDVDGSDVPIIMLTALGDTDDRIAGLQTGADDYIGKPFSVKELALRVGSVLRRSRSGTSTDTSDGPLADGDLVVDPVARTATKDGEPLRLTTRELDLLVFLLRHPGVVHSRADLLPRCGAGTSATTRRSPCTSSGSGTRSSRSRRSLGASSPSTAWATATTSTEDRA